MNYQKAAKLAKRMENEQNEALCTSGGWNRGHLSLDAGVRQLVSLAREECSLGINRPIFLPFANRIRECAARRVLFASERRSHTVSV